VTTRPAPVVLDGRHLSVTAVAAVARDGAPVALAPAARERVVAARAVVETFVTGDVPVYGLTTGLGHKATMTLAPEEREAFQRRMLLGRAVAIGEPLPVETVRAAMVVRASCMAAGGAGVTPGVLDAIIAMLNAGVHPVVGDTASVASADLGILASLFTALLGLGEVEREGRREDAASALGAIGLEPLRLAGRDGLALCSSNAVSAGTAGLAVHDALRLFGVALAAAALSLEGFVGNLSPFDERVLAARPAAGQVEVGRRLRSLLAGSRLLVPGAARRVQDPISFRCTPSVYGAALVALERLRETVEVETAAAADNPLVVANEGEMLSNGNFHSAALALACEGACLALAQLGWLAIQRTQRLLDGRSSGLAPSLTPIGADRVGVGVLTVPLMQIHSELRHLALPAALDTPAVADGVEDHAGGALLAARKLARVVDRLERVIAIELAVAAQAIDLRGSALAAPAMAALHGAVRSVVATLDDDRPLGAEVEMLAGLVRDGALAPPPSG
jgi:histidine ammonia-lyase